MVFIEDQMGVDVFSVFGVVRYLFWLGKPAVISEDEIGIMKNYLNGVYESISLKKITKGQYYKIIEGPLAGNMGRVIETQKNKIKLELKSMGMLVTLNREVA